MLNREGGFSSAQRRIRSAASLTGEFSGRGGAEAAPSRSPSSGSDEERTLEEEDPAGTLGTAASASFGKPAGYLAPWRQADLTPTPRSWPQLGAAGQAEAKKAQACLGPRGGDPGPGAGGGEGWGHPHHSKHSKHHARGGGPREPPPRRKGGEYAGRGTGDYRGEPPYGGRGAAAEARKAAAANIDLPLLYTSCVCMVLLLYFIINVHIDRLHWVSGGGQDHFYRDRNMVKFDVGCGMCASLLLAFFVWLVHALLYDVTGMVVGVFPAIITLCCVGYYRLVQPSNSLLVNFQIAAAAGIWVSRFLDCNYGRKGLSPYASLLADVRGCLPARAAKVDAPLPGRLHV